MRIEMRHGRGRPSGGRRSQVEVRLLEYLAKVAQKYELDPNKFFSCLLESYIHKKRRCGRLLIECRLRERDHAIFLISLGTEVVGQFHVSESLLREKSNPLMEYSQKLVNARRLVQLSKPKSIKIGNIKAGMRRLNIEGQILRTSSPAEILTRSGLTMKFINVLLGDETGTIDMSLVGEQVKGLNVDDFVQIDNAYAVWFRGKNQLRVGKRGKISIINERET